MIIIPAYEPDLRLLQLINQILADCDGQHTWNDIKKLAGAINDSKGSVLVSKLLTEALLFGISYTIQHKIIFKK